MIGVAAVAEIEPEHVDPGDTGPRSRPGLSSPAPVWRRSWRCAAAHGSVRSMRPLPALGDQDSAEIIDVGQGRAGDDRVAERREEAVAVVVGERSRGLDPRAAARASVSGTTIARHCPRAVDPVGIAGDRPTPGSPWSATASASRNSALRPPRPPPRTVTVVSPPESSTQGGGRAARAGTTCSAIPAMHPADLARLALEGIAQHERRHAGLRAPPRRRPRAPAAAWRSSRSAPGQTRVAGLGRLLRAASSGAAPRPAARCGSAQRRPGIGEGRRVGTVGPEAITAGSSPGTSEISRLTTLAGWAAAASRPPLIAERCLRTHVHLADVGAARRASALLTACLSASVSPRPASASSAEPPPEIRHSTRSSGPALRASSRMRPRPRARGVGHRVCGLDDLDPLARHGMAVAGDDQPFERPRPVLLDRLAPWPPRPCRRRPRWCGPWAAPAGAEHDPRRQRRRDRGVEHRPQEARQLVACSWSGAPSHLP